MLGHLRRWHKYTWLLDLPTVHKKRGETVIVTFSFKEKPTHAYMYEMLVYQNHTWLRTTTLKTKEHSGTLASNHSRLRGMCVGGGWLVSLSYSFLQCNFTPYLLPFIICGLQNLKTKFTATMSKWEFKIQVMAWGVTLWLWSADFRSFILFREFWFYFYS